MTKYHNLFAGTITDTEIQVVKENQIIIGFGAGMTESRYVVSKVEHDTRGYQYHLINLETKHIDKTDMIRPLSTKFGIGRYYDDVNPEFLDESQVKGLVEEAEQKAREKAEATANANAEHDRITQIGRERLNRIMPENVQGAIIAQLKETEYTDPSYECTSTRSLRTVILGFSDTSRNGFGELRKVAGNLPETAHLAEYNKNFEHRYPHFSLGESHYSGWSIHKMVYYTREGLIDALAHTAGNEDDIRISKANTVPKVENAQTPAGEFVVVDYSEKCIAVFGDTKPIKAELLDLGGRYNGHLTHNGQKMPGWVFQKAKEPQVREYLKLTE